MWYDLADDEALILRFPDETVAGYYGLQLSNFWGSSSDWANRHVSLSWGLGGSCQAELSQPTGHPAQQLITANGGGRALGKLLRECRKRRPGACLFGQLLCQCSHIVVAGTETDG